MSGKFKIATFNVNSLKARLPIVETWLADEAPDVVCFQETKCQDADFPVDFFTSRGYSVAYRGMKSYNGVAIASRTAAAQTLFGFGDGEDAEQDLCRLASAAFGDLHVICAYVPQGKSIDSPDFGYKLDFFARIRRMLERRYSTTDRVILVGDLNVAPTDIDVTNPKNKRDHVCFCDEVKAALADTASWGLVDVFRQKRPDAGEFSFFDYRVKDALARNIGWRIDHLLATEPLAALCTDAYVVRELRAMDRPSDHTAVVGVFEL